MTLLQRIKTVKTRLPSHVTLVAAAKTRSPQQVLDCIDAGIAWVGHNYVQEAQSMIDQIGRDAAHWTMIGHLQRNKAKVAVRLFDSIQTVDSLRLAKAIDRECKKISRIMPILIEVNAAREPQKAGAFPEDVRDLITEVAKFEAISVKGLMTMGPAVQDPEALRPVFRETKSLFDALAAAKIPRVAMETLSMGMSSSYEIAVEEGATMIRLGTTLFGPRT